LSRASKIAGREPITLHPDDAKARGLAAGDIVRVFNDRGACLAGLRVSDAIRPGVVALATGAWWEPRDGLCIHGNPNVLTQDVGTSRLGQGCAAQSCLVEIERHAGALPPVTVHRPPRVEACGSGAGSS
jgi:biotin/methionine sulfoxide reductase